MRVEGHENVTSKLRQSPMNPKIEQQQIRVQRLRYRKVSGFGVHVNFNSLYLLL